MPIYKLPAFHNNQIPGRPLKEKNYDPKVLMQTMEADSVEQSLISLLDRGKTVYVFINPYESEIGETQVVCGGTSLDAELERYYLLGDEV